MLIKVDNRTGAVSLLLAPYIVVKVSRFNDIRDLVDYLYGKSLIAMLIRPYASARGDHSTELIGILEKIKPRVVLEIGTAKGGTLLLWTRVAADDALIISIDLPGGPFGGGYPLLRKFLYKGFRKAKQRVVLIQGDSHDARTLNKVKSIIGDRKIDFLFIDGDHTYEGVKKDYEMYSCLVKINGVIAFHDIVHGSEELVGGVPRFWEELKEQYDSKRIIELVKSWDQGGYGIGILIK